MKTACPRPNAYAATCPTRLVLDRVADKWAVLILGSLSEEPVRFDELRRLIEGVSQKMLSQTLKSLERDGLVSREAIPTVPVTVEYSVTPPVEHYPQRWMTCGYGQKPISKRW
jgi:DNA-binding HxlR family transcriptional regulator